MKKKLLFVIDSLNSGGAEKSLVSLLTLFDYKKYEVDLLMFSNKGLFVCSLPREVNILEVPYIITTQQNQIKYLLKNKKFKELFIRVGMSFSLRNPFQNKQLHAAQISWKWLSKGFDKVNVNYDVAIAYSQGTPTYFVAEKVQAIKKFCWVNTDYKIAPYNKQFDEKYYMKYDNVIAVSDYNKRVFIEEMPIAKEKTSVVYDIVSPSMIKSMSAQSGGFKDNFKGLRILTIGRLVDVKGYDLAIEACYKLKQEGYEFKWYAIGEGKLKSKLENMIKSYSLEETFVFLGTQENPYTFIKDCDIYVQPSRYEGFGLAIAEARILQKPIIATDFPVIYNQLKNRKTGLIVNMNASALYEGIKEILTNNKLKNEICSNLKKEQAGTEREIEKVYSLIENGSLNK
ncbi:glycosyltransferase [Fictibacillus halophilus]|uniref:glycosyltransferase n=1 Tax=Fictibacillus halophilus TaxID=1610490 RepID=UPI00363625B2